MLLLICFFGCGSYFVFDSPVVVQNYIKLAFNIDDNKYALLYTVYSIPAIIFCIISGVLIDAFGKNKIAIIFMFIILVGQVLLTLSVYFNQYWLAIVARATVGTGVESVAVVCSVFLNSWFKGTSLNTLAFGLSLSIWRGASSLSFVTIEPLYWSGNKVQPKDVAGVVKSDVLSYNHDAKKYWMEDTSNETFFGDKLGDSQYYCYDRIKMESCQMTRDNYHSWFDNETRIQSCDFDKQTLDFINEAYLGVEDGGASCFNKDTFDVSDLQCECLNTDFNATWNDYESFKQDTDSFKSDPQTESSLRDKWWHFLAKIFKQNKESLSKKELEKRYKFFKQAHQNYCKGKFPTLAAKTADFTSIYSKNDTKWTVDTFVKAMKEDHLFARSCGPSKKDLEKDLQDSLSESQVWVAPKLPVKYRGKVAFVKPRDEDIVARRNQVSICYFVMALVPLCSVAIALVINYLDTKAEANMKLDQQIDTKPIEEEKVVFNVNSIVKGLVESLHYMTMELGLLFFMCICFYVGVFTWMTQISDFFEKYKKLPGASELKALIYALALPFNPLLGFIIGKTKKQMIWLTSAFAFSLLSHFIMYADFSKENYGLMVVAIIILAFSYAIIGSSMWPVVGLLVPDKVAGMMYGAMFATQQIGLTIAASLVGFIVTKYSHGSMELFFMLLQCSGFAAGLLLVMRLGASYENFPKPEERYKMEQKTAEEMQTLSPSKEEP